MLRLCTLSRCATCDSAPKCRKYAEKLDKQARKRAKFSEAANARGGIHLHTGHSGEIYPKCL